MLPTLRFAVATILMSLLVVTVGAKLVTHSPSGIIDIGMRSAIGSPLDPSLHEHPAWTEQRQALDVVRRAIELSRLRESSVALSAQGTISPVPAPPQKTAPSTALKPARARLAPPSPDPGIEGAEETNFAFSPDRDDMIAEQQLQAAQQPSGADVQQSQTEVQPLQEAQPAAAADAPFDPPPAKSEPEPASIRRTPIGEVAPARAGAEQEMADIVAEESTSSVNPSIENPPQPRERPAVTKRRARPKAATRRLPGIRARQILAAQRIPPAQWRSAAAAIPSPGPDSGTAAAASRTTTFMQNGSH